MFFFSVWVSFYAHSRFTGQQEKGETIYLTPLYHFHPLYKHLDISRVITAERSPLHIASSRTQNREPLVSEGKSLDTKLRAFEEMFNEKNTKRMPLEKCLMKKKRNFMIGKV